MVGLEGTSERTTGILNAIKKREVMFQAEKNQKKKTPLFFSDLLGCNSSVIMQMCCNVNTDMFPYSGSQTGRKEHYRRKMWVSFPIAALSRMRLYTSDLPLQE